jgi:hypothetical protein
MIRFEPLTQQLLQAIALKPEDALLAERRADQGTRIAMCLPGNGWAMMEDETIVGAGGVITFCWEGRGLAWMVAGSAARPRHVAQAARFAEGWIEHLVHSGRYRRVEATVPIGKKQGCLLMRHLHFTCEGLMNRFDRDGTPHWLFARTAA